MLKKVFPCPCLLNIASLTDSHRSILHTPGKHSELRGMLDGRLPTTIIPLRLALQKFVRSGSTTWPLIVWY